MNVQDIKSQAYGITQSYFSGNGWVYGIRTLTYVLGDGNLALAAAFILFYLILQVLGTDPKLLALYGGYVVRTAEQIEISTGCSRFTNSKAAINLLVEKGLISTDNHASCSKTRYRVNFDTLVECMDKADKEVRRIKESYTERQNEIKQNDNERRSASTGAKEEVLKRGTDLESVFGEEGNVFVHLFNHYYESYTGKKYEWTLIKYNTMIKAWREGLDRDYLELALSRAIKESLDDGSSNFFEKKWVYHFNPDSNKKTSQIIIDNLLTIEG